MFGLWNKDRGAKVQDTVVFKGVALSIYFSFRRLCRFRSVFLNRRRLLLLCSSPGQEKDGGLRIIVDQDWEVEEAK